MKSTGKSKSFLTDEQCWSIWRVSRRFYGRPKNNRLNHHWKRLDKCSNALQKTNWNEDEAIQLLIKGK